MRRSYFSDKTSRLIALLDAVVVLASVTLALTIRAQFSGYLVNPVDILVLVPWVLLLRILTNTIFEHYSVNVLTFTSADYSGLLLHNLLPTAVLIALRFLSPLRQLKMPLSVTAMEYIFTCFGFVVVRLVALRLMSGRRSHEIRHRPHIVLWGEVREIIDRQILSGLLERDHVRVVAILTANPLYWDTQVQGIRVFGDESHLMPLIERDESISAICISNLGSESRSVLHRLSGIASALGVKLWTAVVEPPADVTLREILTPEVESDER